MDKFVKKLRRVFSATEKGRGEHGLFVLVDKPSTQSDVLDIISLHGLNGHYKNTWSTQLPSGQSYSWLENDLAKAIPNARILSYGYDSKIFSKSVADISEFATLLLEQILARRSTPTERKRPLLFLCHSLGGIIFKKVLTGKL